MLRDYPPLIATSLQAGVGYAQPTQPVPDIVTLEDSALTVLTDFQRVTAIIILPGDTVDEAHRRMIQRAVRLLLVVNQDRRVVGAITANDILGEKPMQAIAQRGIRREELQVRDIMIPQERIDVFRMSDLRAAKVGHVVATLRNSGRQHAMAVDVEPNGRQTVRGVFSATQIARQLGIVLQPGEIARTFAEIEALLAQ